IPMDRLVCGDVGFGKTEIAIRAAFKAVADSKQVAILVPTTILAMQHYYTFTERLKDFPCSVDYISRFKKPAQQKEIIKKLETGKLDIVIGTHRLVGKDISFKNLGLLIIDEEQKFGVAVKEKLKAIKVNVDTLTLTATPIPRTMQFSLMGARDLSIIKTPPPNRYPIVTELCDFRPDTIREAINYEIERNGQVFIIHNRIQNINDIEALINKICPKVKTIVGHGQMEGKKLENIMLGFIEGDYDVLISTTIVENGLDIPNANTIIINNAQNFGLSELHQLRGRVGRSNKKAFCYLISPPVHSLPPESRRRLKAIEDFSELGSGFNIALSDLDIRGAGNLLGGEQSGFISDIGFETYQRILDEALLELRDNEYKELFAGKDKEKENRNLEKFISDCNIETDMEVLLPDFYIANVSERIRLYRELDNTKDEKSLQQFQKQLTDRFGKMPKESKALMNIVRLRWLANRLGLVKLILKNKKMVCYFNANQESSYFESEAFSKVLNYIQFARKKCRMKEANNRLRLVFEYVPGINNGIDLLKEVLKG
ncbi:MAG: TRCF domain-containing protein, partial [Bacteroidota bacterium]|nr:TRCF domain-containing protein [Bacteroidota bacterium]